MSAPWETISSELHSDCKIFSVHRHKRKSSLSGKVFDFFSISGHDWVNIIPITGDRKVIMVRQFRHGILQTTLELPGGALHENEDPVVGGMRECAEETGFSGANGEIIGFSYPNPAIQQNKISFVLMKDSKLSQPQNLDPAEEIDVELVNLNEIPTLIKNQTINHALVITAFHFLQLHDPNIYNP